MLTEDEKTIFLPTEFRSYKDKIKLDYPLLQKAESGARFLMQEFANAKSRSKKFRVFQFAQLNSNRAMALQGKPDLTERERVELLEVHKIYNQAAEAMRARLPVRR